MKSTLRCIFLLLVATFVISCGEAAKSKPYPLTTCIVSGEKLGSMGEPIVFVHEGQEVQFCCKACKPKFEKEPAKYLAQLKDAVK